MAIVKFLTFLVVIASTVALAHCSVTQPPDCTAICQHLQRCQYLPSVLGASSPGQESPESDCAVRCKNSSEAGPYRWISNCHASYPSEAECENFGQCLRVHFPGVPITGLSNVNIQSTSDFPSGLGDQGCAGDAGVARSFVETWGNRQYGDTRSCNDRLIDFFDDVSADARGHVGLQFGRTLSGADCHEIRQPRAIPPGYFEVQVPLKDEPTQVGACTDVQSLDASINM